jgi:hypothetical protein
MQVAAVICTGVATFPNSLLDCATARLAGFLVRMLCWLQKRCRPAANGHCHTLLSNDMDQATKPGVLISFVGSKQMIVDVLGAPHLGLGEQSAVLQMRGRCI